VGLVLTKLSGGNDINIEAMQGILRGLT